MKKIMSSILKPIRNFIRRRRIKTMSGNDQNQSIREVFSKIYNESAWGASESKDDLFYSGLGSHDHKIVSPYIEAITDFLLKFREKPVVVDLGCGDFSIGSRLRAHCGKYIACDIVQELIEFNKTKYAELNVDFRVLDLTEDQLPRGDIVFIRQVLQHLSNNQIMKAIPKLASQYKYLVLTEHLPSTENFEHNIDKEAGAGVRTRLGSGVVLTSAPFNMAYRNKSILCSVDGYGGRIITTLYEF